MALLLDTGPIYAAANNRDRHHQTCLDLLRSATPPFVVPSLVVAEVCYLVGENLGPAAETDFFRMLCSDRFRIEPVTDADLARIVVLTEAYAERLGFETVATLDRRHFSVVRPTG